ncbi:M16 family metallopeptidase [Sulfurovum sp. NBC37-1]|uniref:M16 family metallopeptidase n=1 Tax=Sulfurovum sp. (strain NBC37-1) TaxID=387093 RepID=UPI0001587C5E|nr:pitrilysin family protein [Sulfurovum sp. NBC37-1]BAF72863.1 processing protease [Sulfurovum sp. NBC37-1]
MAETVKEVKIKDTQVPVVFEEGNFIPIVSLQLVFTNAGHLSNTKDGLADMSAKLLNEGTKKDGSVGFAQKLDDHAVDVTAHVGRESFVFEVSALKSEFPYAIERLKELLKDPNYTPEALEQVKRQKIGWLTQKKSDFDYIAATKLREILFKGTPLARPYDGTIESVKSISLDDIENFVSTHLGYNNAIAVIGGDISFDEAEKYVNELLPLLPKVKKEKTPWFIASDKKEVVLIPEDTQQAYIYFGAPFDYTYKEKDQYKAKIAEYILGGAGFGSRLMEEIRVKRGLTYGAYSMLRRTKYASYLSGYLQTKLSTQDEAKALVQKVVDDFVSKGITADELESAKKFLVGSEPLRMETLSQRLNRAYNEFYYGRPLGFSKEQLEKIETVTLDEMNAFITSHKELSDLSFSIVTKK